MNTGSAPDPGFVAAVQANCDIADAQHAADLPLCSFLLQMREYYRWQRGLPFDAPLPRDALGAWLAEREAAWQRLEGRRPAPLPLDGHRFDPFDLDAINARLRPRGWLYGAGWAPLQRPVFFVAALDRVWREPEGSIVMHAGREFARGLLAPPATLQGGTTIVLRRESIARWLWERFEAFSLRRADGPFKAVADAHALDDPAAFVAALPGLVDLAATMMLQHEHGERQVGRELGPGWSALRVAQADRRAALALHAVRDLLADCGHTVPTLLAEGPAAALHLWFASFDGLRQELFPGLAAAGAAWRQGDGGAALRAGCVHGQRHFGRLASALLAEPEPGRVAGLLASEAAICGWADARDGRRRPDS